MAYDQDLEDVATLLHRSPKIAALGADCDEQLVRPSAPGKTKREAYECGIPTDSDTRGRYSVRFYLVAILFVIFDIETIFLIPWAIQYNVLGLFGLIEMLVFLAILIVGYVWIYRQGALKWV